MSGAHIKNLAVEGVNISADGTGNFNTGAIAGFMVGGSISNSYMTGAVASAGASSEVGGLVGKMQGGGRILNSYALGTVSAKRYAGGLVGATAGTNTIANSFAQGAVTGANSTGGLVGNMLGVTVRNSYAAGQVSSAERAGGLAGTMGGGSIHDSYAMGAVSSSWDKIQRGVGGLVGDFNSGSINNSYATGSLSLLSSWQKLGGLVGWIANTGASISASYVNLDAEHSQSGVNISVSNKRLVGGRANTHALVENKVYGKTTAELKALTAAGTGWSAANWSFAALPGVLYVQNPSTAANAPKWCGAEGNSDELPVCGTLIPGQRLSATIADGGACTARDLKDWQDGVCEKTKMGQTRTCTDGTEGDGSCDWSCLGVAVKKWRIDVSCVACKARTLTEWANAGCTAPNSGIHASRHEPARLGQKGNGGCTWSCAGIAESQTGG